jgi:cyclopropane fatty-acyl-phospholipid synthase-like methyltransferase
MTNDRRLFSPSTERNRSHILAILQRLLPDPATVLEIGSGSGEHAVYFCAHMPWLHWQPTDGDPAAIDSIIAWISHSGLPNIAAPLELELHSEVWPVRQADAVVAINVLHYSPWSSTPALFRTAARLLPKGGVVYCYGPYRRGNAHTAPSNAAFDEWLHGIDERFGVRDLEAVEAEAREHGFRLDELIEMPANNFSLVFRRE